MVFQIFRQFSVVLGLALMVAMASAAPAAGQSAGMRDGNMPGAPPEPRGDMPAGFTPPLLQKARDTAGVDERLGDFIPADVELIDSAGRRVRLGDYFDGQRPVIIQMAYYRCPSLCGEISKGMVRSVRQLSQDLRLGQDFEVLTISFDSREPASLAAGNKQAVQDVLGREFGAEAVRDGWSFFVGEDVHLKRLTDALGYRFGWIEEAEQYSHPAAIVVCAPDGKITRYLYGVSHEAQTVRLSLIDASQGTIRPSLADAFILSCFAYDPTVGKYTPVAIKLMRLAGIVTVLTLAGIIGFLVVAEKRGRLRRSRYAGTPAEGEVAPDPVDDDEDGPPPPPAPRTAFSG